MLHPLLLAANAANILLLVVLTWIIVFQLPRDCRFGISQHNIKYLQSALYALIQFIHFWAEQFSINLIFKSVLKNRAGLCTAAELNYFKLMSLNSGVSKPGGKVRKEARKK